MSEASGHSVQTCATYFAYPSFCKTSLISGQIAWPEIRLKDRQSILSKKVEKKIVAPPTIKKTNCKGHTLLIGWEKQCFPVYGKVIMNMKQCVVYHWFVSEDFLFSWQLQWLLPFMTWVSLNFGQQFGTLLQENAPHFTSKQHQHDLSGCKKLAKMEEQWSRQRCTWKTILWWINFLVVLKILY